MPRVEGNPPADIAGYDPIATAGDCYYDKEAAELSVQFFEKYATHVKGPLAGKQFCLEPWQADINRTLFGWKRPDGLRRYRICYVEVPRKNGKSTWMAGNTAYMLFADGEGGAEIYNAAGDKEQASLVFNICAGMIRNAPNLNDACRIKDSQKKVSFGDSFLRAIPANEGGSHGFNSHAIIGDELHTWPKRDFYDTLHTSTGARSQPLEWYITTSGFDRNSICYEIHTYSEQVRDGKIDDETFLPVLYGIDEQAHTEVATALTCASQLERMCECQKSATAAEVRSVMQKVFAKHAISSSTDTESQKQSLEDDQSSKTGSVLSAGESQSDFAQITAMLRATSEGSSATDATQELANLETMKQVCSGHSTTCPVRDVDFSKSRITFDLPGDVWTEPRAWRRANPNIGISVTTEYIERECKRAQTTPAYENTFKRLHLNIWTSQESRWIQMEKWRACPGTEGDIKDGATVFGGIDLSSNIDITAWMLCQRVDDGFRLQGHYFIPEGTMRRAEKRDRVPYSQWVKKGWVTATPGDSIDYAYLHSMIIKDSERYNMGPIGYDPWNAESSRQILENKGLTMVKLRQGMASLSEPSKTLEACVIDGTLDHGADPVLEWMAENVTVKTDDNGNIKPVKPDHAGSSKRIDGIVAAIMSISMAQLTEPKKPSIYETPGMLSL